MATSKLIEESILTCSICFEFFHQPVTLVCEHNFCQVCLKKYLQTKKEGLTTKTIPCPTCRQETRVPQPDRPVDEWAEQLKPGLLLTQLMDSLQESMTKRFLCKRHEERIKFYCKHCKEVLCTECWRLNHRGCHDVVEMQVMLPEIKRELLDRQQAFNHKLEETTANICEYGKEWERNLFIESKIRKEIEQKVQHVAQHLENKKAQLLKKIEDHSEYKWRKQKQTVRSQKYKLQMYQHQSEDIQQTLESGNEKQMFETFLSRRIGAEADASKMYSSSRTEFLLADGATSRLPGSSDVTEIYRREMTGRADIKFEHELEKLINAIDKIDIKLNVIDLKANPVLQETIDCTLTLTDKCQLTGVVILKVNDTNVTVVTDVNKNRVKSFYKTETIEQSSKLILRHPPVSIAVLDEDKVVVSVPGSHAILTLSVLPDLDIDSKITTRKKYTGVDVLDQRTLVACLDSPSSVDILNLQGQVIRSLPNPHIVFSCSYFTHVTRQGAILVSDWSRKSVICLDQTLLKLWDYTPTGDRALGKPCGMTSTPTGDILVADRDKHKVIHLNSSGEFVREVLTSENGLEHPMGLFVDGETLCVANICKGVKIFSLPEVH